MTVSHELHDEVLKRDGCCFMVRLDPNHICRDQYGNMHSANYLPKLTVDHVHLDGAHMGKRAPDDARHLVALCADSNVRGPSRAVREAERDYLLSLYPDPDA